MSEAFELWNDNGERELSVSFPDWMGKGRCACGSDTRLDDFFAQDDSSGLSTEQVYGAKRLCADCPVRTECLEWALDWNNGVALDDDGIFGGLTPSERNFASQAEDPLAFGLRVLDEQIRLGIVRKRVPRFGEMADVDARGS